MKNWVSTSTDKKWDNFLLFFLGFLLQLFMFIFTLSCFILGLYPLLAEVLVGKTRVPGVKTTDKLNKFQA